MYDYDDIVTAVTFRINGLATQDVLSHIHNVFSDKIADLEGQSSSQFNGAQPGW